MPSPPPPPLPPPRRSASRTFLQALNALSPSSLFRIKQQHALPQAPTKPSMPAPVMALLLQLVDFLEEHHRREEGLYRKPAPSAREKHAVLRVLRGADEDEPLPDLAMFSPHSLTAAIKEVLGEDYAPLIPYRLSQSLVEHTAQQHDDAATVTAIFEAVKELAPATCELLKVLLIHLHHISMSVPSRMSPKSLATHVGILLVRPHEETETEVAKSVFKRRRRVARLLIENANSLPYNETNRSSRSGGEKKDSSSGATGAAITYPRDEQNESSIAKSVHYIQVMWDTHESTHSEETLRELLSRFGSIATLAINQSGNRAIVAFTTDDGARAAATARLDGLRIRRRKQRNQESVTPKPTDSDFTTPTPSPEKDVDPKQPQPATQTQHARSSGALDDSCSKNDDKLHGELIIRLKDGDQEEIPVAIDQSEGESPTFLHKLERPPSLLLVQKAMKNMLDGEVMTLEDMESAPTSPETTLRGDKDSHEHRRLQRINEATEEEERSVVEADENAATLATPNAVVESDNHRELQRRRSLKQILSVVTGMSTNMNKEASQMESDGERQTPRKRLLSPPGLIADLKLMIARKRTPRSVNDLRGVAEVEPVITQPVSSNNDHTQDQPAAIIARSVRTQTKITIHPVQHQATDTDDLPPVVDHLRRRELEYAQGQVEALTLCLREVHSELTNLASAIRASRPSDIDQAILQAHTKLSARISQALERDSANRDKNDRLDDHTQDPTGSATSEFISFLETRAASQVKVLEAEMRAGQELLRLHRSQHQKEVSELETEITRLHVMQRETEKMCSELRSELRKCRSELTCHIATAASIQRDRRETDEKLIICENKLRAKEQELLQLQADRDEMREIAVNAQKRLEEHRGSSSQLQSRPEVYQSNQSSAGAHFPKVAAFLKQHAGEVQQKTPNFKTSAMGASAVRPSPFKNTEELASLKRKLEESIQIQVESTKNSLRELQAFGNNQQIGDGVVDLDELKEQLALAHDDLNSTMNASRQKLRNLLDPVQGVQGDSDDDGKGLFDHTGLVEGLLAKAFASDCVETNQEGLSAPENDALPFQPVELMMPSWKSRSSDIQSELFRHWMRRRAGEPTKAMATSVSRKSISHSKARRQLKDDAVQQAQESMLRFQQTLASMTKPPQ